MFESTGVFFELFLSFLEGRAFLVPGSDLALHRLTGLDSFSVPLIFDLRWLSFTLACALAFTPIFIGHEHRVLIG